MKRLAINGFGRIGRAFFRLAFGKPDIEIVAINDPFIALDEARYLLSRDSVYGRFDRTVSTDDKGLTVNGSPVPLIGEKDPTKLPWGDFKIDVVIESTGVFRAYDGPKGAAQHLVSGAKRVLLSVPPKGEGAEKIPQIVYGVNHKDVESSAPPIVSAASCTTNSLVPVAYVLEKEFGIARGFLSTIHGYTADQRLVDASHKDYARGRAAAINIVPTTTGAAKATAKVIASLAGKMDGMAFRVPVVTGSASDFTAEIAREVTVDAINATLKRYADGELAGVLGVSEDPMVSTDIIGDPRASVVDLSSTRVVAQRLLKVVTFYDNEWGYTNQLLRVATLL